MSPPKLPAINYVTFHLDVLSSLMKQQATAVYLKRSGVN
jgi:hypothetical protein